MKRILFLFSLCVYFAVAPKLFLPFTAKNVIIIIIRYFVNFSTLLMLVGDFFKCWNQRQRGVQVYPQWFSPDSAVGGGVGSLTERRTWSASARPLLYPEKATQTHKHTHTID